MKLKIPPAVVTAVCMGLMWMLNHIAIGFIGLPWSDWIALLLLGLAGILGIMGLYQFYRDGTSIDPHKPEKTSSLVTDGIYQVSRNPMYLALFVILIAYGVALQNMFSLLCLPLFVWYMNRYQIIPEEEIMEEKFGDEYREYESEVRRWL